MARTIEETEESITAKLEVDFSLSSSAVAEWRLWVHAVAYAIHIFELALDVFQTEMDADAKKEVAGTLTWYNDKCYEFQLGHELLFNTTTGLLGYEKEDLEARVVKIASVNVRSEDGMVFFRVATENEEGEIVPLSSSQLLNFKNYIDAIKFAGTRSTVISTAPDEIRYSLTIYFYPVNPAETVRDLVLAALEGFKTSQKFGGMIYRHKLIEAVTSVNGVVTAKLDSFSRKGADTDDFVDIDIFSLLHSGYYNYTEDSVLTLISINNIQP